MVTRRRQSTATIVNIREQTKIGDYMVVDNAAGLIALARRNILEFHTWNSTTRRLETPNRIVLDLDPGPLVPWRVVVDPARQVRALVQDLGLGNWPKTKRVRDSPDPWADYFETRQRLPL
jgi:bifunctional non-homologous end joining protein LigD